MSEFGFTKWDVVLPVGISFYTFHTITYIVDNYRGTVKPTRNLFEFSAYVSLFSQLVAGPIVRFRQIEEDLERLGGADRTRWLGIGVAFFMIGMIEKVLVADSLAPFVHQAFSQHASLTTLDVLARRARVFLPALFRFLWIQFDGRGAWLHVRTSHSDQSSQFPLTRCS